MKIINCVKKPDLFDSATFSLLSGWLPPKRISRIERFIHQDDKIRALIADVLIRTMVYRVKGIKKDKLEFQENAYGKPALLNHSDIHFNISHSVDWVVCALDNKPVGIDIEKIKETDFGIAKKFFSKSEFDELTIKTGNDKLSFFYNLWTMKESYIKALGKGFSKSLGTFSICIKGQEVTIDDDEQCNSLTNYFITHYDIDKKYKMALCSQNRTPAKCEIVGFNTICDEFLNQ